MSVVPVFTELCRTDSKAYVAFAQSLVAYYNGTSSVKFDGERWGCCHGAYYCRSDDDCKRVVFDNVGASSVRPSLMDVGVCVGVDDGDGSGGSDVGTTRVVDKGPVVGVPVSVVDSDGGELDCEHGAEQGWNASADVGKTGRQSVPVVNEKHSVASRGPNWERNCVWRLEKKKKKLRKRARSSVGLVTVKTDLQKGLEAKWAAENELARCRAERQLAVLRATDVADDVRQHRTRVCLRTERNMVGIEKVHAELRTSGNVSDDADTRVQTVLSSGGVSSSGIPSGTITPNSSVSEAEVRKLQKDFEDLKAQHAELLENCRKLGVNPNLGRYVDKETFTEDSDVDEFLDALYPDGVVTHYVDRGGVKKVKIGVDPGAEFPENVGRATGDGLGSMDYAAARKWVERYKYLEKFAADPDLTREGLAKKCHVSVAEVHKYFRLKEEFKINF